MKLSRDTFTRINDAKVFRSRTAFVSHVFRGKKLKFLDIGNLGDDGTDLGLRELITKQGGEYWGLDINEHLAKKLGYKNQLIGDVCDLSSLVKENSFDAVYLGQVIEHTWHPSMFMREIERVLKKGGLFVLSTPNVHDVLSLAQVYLKKRNTQGDVPELSYEEAKDNFASYRAEKNLLSQPQHKIFYGPSALRQLLNEHGFAVETMVYIDKSSAWWHRLFLRFFPQGSNKIGVVAVKKDVDTIFRERQFGDPA